MGGVRSSSNSRKESGDDKLHLGAFTVIAREIMWGVSRMFTYRIDGGSTATNTTPLNIAIALFSYHQTSSASWWSMPGGKRSFICNSIFSNLEVFFAYTPAGRNELSDYEMSMDALL